MLHPDTLSVAIPLIEEFEGIRYEAYLCPAGIPTICAGLTRYPSGEPVRMGDVCSDVACEGHLRTMLEKQFAPSLEKIPDFGIFGPSRQAALLSFAWNMGAHFYGAEGFDTISRVLRTKSYGEMRAAFLLYCRAGGQTLPGLERRRKEEADLWDSEGEIPMSAKALSDTYLKVCAVSSECLVEGKGKIEVKSGDVIKLAEFKQADSSNHSQFVISGSGEKWYAYMPHWELVTAKKS